MLRNLRSISRFPSSIIRFINAGTTLKVCGLLCAALIALIYFGRPAASQNGVPNPTADVLPQMNIIAGHKVDAEEYARQIKSRYASDSPEYQDAERRYTSAMIAFNHWVDAVEQAVTADTDVKNSKEFKDLAHSAVDASTQFHIFAESTLHLGSASMTSGATAPDADAAVGAGSRIQKAYGKKAAKDKDYLAKDMRVLVKWKAWSDILPVSATSTAPSPAPSILPAAAPSSSASPQPSGTP